MGRKLNISLLTNRRWTGQYNRIVPFISIAHHETLGFPQDRALRNPTVMSRSILSGVILISEFASGGEGLRPQQK